MPVVLLVATGGKERLSYNIDHLNCDVRKQGPPTSLVFNETTHRLSGYPSGDPGWDRLYHSVSDASGRTKEASFTLAINGPIPQRFAPAIAQPELGTLDRGLIRCGVWLGKISSLNSRGFQRLVRKYIFCLASPSQFTIDSNLGRPIPR